MASKKTKALAKAKPAPAARYRGRPPLYRPEFCEMLVTHMGANEEHIAHTFESFGAIAGVDAKTLYLWQREYPDFLAAHKRGLAVAEQAIAYNLYKMAKGQFTITYERTFWDGKSGQFLKEVVTEPAKTNAAALIFLAKNVCGWKDRREVNVTGDDGKPVQVRVESYEEKVQRIEELRRAREEIAQHAQITVIDHQPEKTNEPECHAQQK